MRSVSIASVAFVIVAAPWAPSLLPALSNPENRVQANCLLKQRKARLPRSWKGIQLFRDDVGNQKVRYCSEASGVESGAVSGNASTFPEFVPACADSAG
jgi:hypothetical protein